MFPWLTFTPIPRSHYCSPCTMSFTNVLLKEDIRKTIQDPTFAMKFDPSFRGTKNSPELRPAVSYTQQVYERSQVTHEIDTRRYITGKGHTSSPNVPAGGHVAVMYHHCLLDLMCTDDTPINGIEPSRIAKILRKCTTFVFDDLTPEWFGTFIRLVCADPKLADRMDKNQHVPLGDLIYDAAIRCSELKRYSTVEIADKLVSCNRVLSFKTAKDHCVCHWNCLPRPRH